MDGVEEDVNKLELEEQFILRIPVKDAKKVRKILRKKPKKTKDMLSIELDVESREGAINIRKKCLKGKLVDLPTITESCKTTDKVNMFKTANISQMFVCNSIDNNKIESKKIDANEIVDDGGKENYSLLHGLTPPLKNVKRRRFRKTLRNTNDLAEQEDVEKEVLVLLRADNEAVSSRFEIIYENDPNNNRASTITEEILFGEVLSSSDTDGSDASGLNDLIDYTN